MTYIHIIKHWLQEKIYNAVLNIQIERDEILLSKITTTIKKLGTCPSIRKDSFFAGTKHVEIGDNFRCGIGAWVEAVEEWDQQVFHPRIVIGNNFNMQHYCHIGCIESVEIGNNVLLGSKVYISDHFHGNITEEDIDVPPIKRPLTSKPIKIGNNVWIGDNVAILPGVTLGNNVIVGANAVVTKSFPDNAVIAGVPAKVIKLLC